jgi:hypothetical protein
MLSESCSAACNKIIHLSTSVVVQGQGMHMKVIKIAREMDGDEEAAIGSRALKPNKKPRSKHLGQVPRLKRFIHVDTIFAAPMSYATKSRREKLKVCCWLVKKRELRE